MKPYLVILAAGLGSRYGGLKQMDPLGPHGESIIDYSVFDAVQAGFSKIIFVLREEIVDDFYSLFANHYRDYIEVDHVIQRLEDIPEGISLNPDRKKPWGTGHAMLAAGSKLDHPFGVINGDDFYGKEAFQVMHRFLTSVVPDDPALQAMVGYTLSNTLSDFGYVSRGVCEVNKQRLLTKVVERTKIEKKEEDIIYLDEEDQPHFLTGEELVSMNFWGFTPAILPEFSRLFHAFMEQDGNQLKSEFYIPSAINRMIIEGKTGVSVLNSPATWFGVTYQEDKPFVRDQLAQLHTTGSYPSPLWPAT
ncbi:MAG: NTP transferase domain-containing protein [Bacteroidales bacterium]|nr:NTP transferase domain-containing protein [Bacteroidales bacterium]